jgi:hypothetical protein
MPMGHKIQDLAEYPGAALRDDELHIVSPNQVPDVDGSIAVIS